jgi:energy-coupling factor transport system ATP-binding protein
MAAMDLISGISKNHTVIIIEHRLEDVLYRPPDRIILLEGGRIISDSGPAELLKSGVLPRCGIREPLFLKAMKYAHCGLDDVASVLKSGAFTLSPENGEKLRSFFQSKVPGPKEETGDEIIRVEDLSFAYEEASAEQALHQALRRVSLRVRRGEAIAVIGKNGAGKSTLAKLLCGVARPSGGAIFLDGKILRL